MAPARRGANSDRADIALGQFAYRRAMTLRKTSLLLDQAGVEHEVADDGIRAASGHYRPTVRDVSRGVTRTFDAVVQRLFMAQLRERVIQELADDFYLRLSTGNGAVELRNPIGNRVAVVHPTSARTFSALDIVGNFVAGGPHWDRLRDRLPYRKRSRPARPPSAVAAASPARTYRRLTALPACATAQQREAAVRASVRLREDRCLELPRPALLRLPHGSLRFAPIQLTARGPELGFEFAGATGRLVATLALRCDTDPMALRTADWEPSDELVTFAWVAALSWYAELTCTPPPAATSDRHHPPAPKRNGRGGAAPAARSASSSRGRAWVLPDRLIATKPTRALLDSFVAGHRRRLTGDRYPSQAARRRADDIGVTLHQHETWVRPHVRGLPATSTLEFTSRHPLP